MLSRLGFHRRRNIDNALADLERWATDAWRTHWETSSQDDLQAELDDFLPDAMDHAQANPDLKSIYSARITRTVLLGIKYSNTHDVTEYEGALGVPMPKEGAR